MATAATIIKGHRDEIFESWLKQATKAASARGLDRPELSNIMPVYLDSLAEAGEDFGSFTGDRRKNVESHYRSRMLHGFQLAEVVEEFALLGRCIARAWQSLPVEEQPTPDDVERLASELHHASTAIVDLFAKHMVSEEQTEKRYLRLLQSMAREALAADAEPLKKGLNQLLELIMEAMDAQTAALLLYLPGGTDLITAASTGVAHEDLELYASKSGLETFAQKIAGDPEPVEVTDVVTTELEVSDSLRQSGIHSLLGVRLPQHRALVGVMYIGLLAQREFTAVERTRIQSLGQQLAIHLESAKLHANLKEKVDALHEERTLRERFVSILAHDLRGPLGAAKLGADALIRHPDRLDQRRDIASRISTNIDRADRMIRDLLDANRIRAGERVPIRLEPTDLVGLAKEVVAELQEAHGDRFVIAGDPEVKGIWNGDELQRALWNLASNAVKYGAPGTPITLTLQRREDHALASVHNEGAAIPEEEQAHLFEPFARTRSAQLGVAKGWGLGLTLVHGCAEDHGGSVEVKSAAGAGTTFTLKLPLDARPYQESAIERPKP